MNVSSLEQHVSLLRIRKKWALIYTVVFAVLFLLGQAFVLWMAWRLEGEPISLLSAMLLGMVFSAPLIGLIVQASDYRRYKGEIELLDALQRAASETASSG